MSELEKQKLEAAGSNGAVQVLRMENDGHVVGPAAITGDSKIGKVEIATAHWSEPTSGLPSLTRNPETKRIDYAIRQLDASGRL